MRPRCSRACASKAAPSAPRPCCRVRACCGSRGRSIRGRSTASRRPSWRAPWRASHPRWRRRGCSCGCWDAAGDVALTFKALGGVYIAGGVACGLGPLLDEPQFRNAFEAHPPYEALLARSRSC